MKKFSRILALLLCLAMMLSVVVISAQAADTDVADVAADADVADDGADVDAAQTGADQIIIHVDSPNKTPYIYYWNALPTNKETAYPGVKMSSDAIASQHGGNWYTYTFSNTTKINFLLTDGTTGKSGQITGELAEQIAEMTSLYGRS